MRTCALDGNGNLMLTRCWIENQRGTGDGVNSK
jgi:hypothetical protein